MSTPPDLARLQLSDRGPGPASGSNLRANEPLHGFVPRNVIGKQVRNAVVCIPIS